jgi:hypothetical protein
VNEFEKCPSLRELNGHGSLVIEIVPRDQDSKYVDLPNNGDKVEVWGAWVKDKPKG